MPAPNGLPVNLMVRITTAAPRTSTADEELAKELMPIIGPAQADLPRGVQREILGRLIWTYIEASEVDDISAATPECYANPTPSSAFPASCEPTANKAG
jgi:hypothetical protein